MKRLFFGIVAFLFMMGIFIFTNTYLFKNLQNDALALTEKDFETQKLVVKKIVPEIKKKLGKATGLQFFIYTNELKYPFKTEVFQHISQGLNDENSTWQTHFGEAYKQIKPSDEITIKAKKATIKKASSSTFLNKIFKNRNSVFIYSLSKANKEFYKNEINYPHTEDKDISPNTANLIIVLLSALIVFVFAIKFNIIKKKMQKA